MTGTVFQVEDDLAFGGAITGEATGSVSWDGVAVGSSLSMVIDSVEASDVVRGVCSIGFRSSRGGSAASGSVCVLDEVV